MNHAIVFPFFENFETKKVIVTAPTTKSQETLQAEKIAFLNKHFHWLETAKTNYDARHDVVAHYKP